MAAVATIAATSSVAYAQSGERLVALNGGTQTMPAGSTGSLSGVAQYELRGPKRTKPGLAIPGPSTATRTIATDPATGSSATSGKRAKSDPALLTDWEGVNHRGSRLAFGGNQYSGEPPDQGLCAGNGFVFETVNQALRVYDTNGSPRTGTISLNEFYGFPPAINRANVTFPGPFLFDASATTTPRRTGGSICRRRSTRIR